MPDEERLASAHDVALLDPGGTGPAQRRRCHGDATGKGRSALGIGERVRHEGVGAEEGEHHHASRQNGCREPGGGDQRARRREPAQRPQPDEQTTGDQRHERPTPTGESTDDQRRTGSDAHRLDHRAPCPRPDRSPVARRRQHPCASSSERSWPRRRAPTGAARGISSANSSTPPPAPTAPGRGCQARPTPSTAPRTSAAATRPDRSDRSPRTRWRARHRHRTPGRSGRAPAPASTGANPAIVESDREQGQSDHVRAAETVAIGLPPGEHDARHRAQEERRRHPAVPRQTAEVGLDLWHDRDDRQRFEGNQRDDGHEADRQRPVRRAEQAGRGGARRGGVDVLHLCGTVKRLKCT